MASDNLNELGKVFKSTQDSLEFSERRIAENILAIERSNDQVGVDFIFKHEFVLVHLKHRVKISLRIQPTFDENAIAQQAFLPLTISQTGLSVGNPGIVGSQDIWYPLAFFGDLNFSNGNYYGLILDVETYLNNTSIYKVSFTEGEVDVTDVTTIGTSVISIPMTYSKLISPPNLIIHHVFVYGKVTSSDPAAWLFYKSAVKLKNSIVYSSTVTGIPPVYTPPPSMTAYPSVPPPSSEVKITGHNFLVLPTRLLLDTVIAGTTTPSSTGAFLVSIITGPLEKTQTLIAEQLSGGVWRSVVLMGIIVKIP